MWLFYGRKMKGKAVFKGKRFLFLAESLIGGIRKALKLKTQWVFNFYEVNCSYDICTQDALNNNNYFNNRYLY